MIASLALLLLTQGSPTGVLAEPTAEGFRGVVASQRAGEAVRWQATLGFGLDTRFMACSVSKLFTAVLIMQEVERGRLGLDTPASELLPELEPILRKSSVRDLLTHGSDLPDFDAPLPRPGGDPVPLIRRPGVADRPGDTLRAYLQLGARPVEPRQFRYNNLDSVALAAVLEKVNRRSFARLLQARIARPIGLKRTSVTRDEKLPNGVPPDRETQESAPATVVANFGRYSGAGAVVTSAGDLVRFGQAILDGTLVSGDSWRAISGNPRFGFVGLGGFVTSRRVEEESLTIFERSGAIRYWQVRLILVPERRLTQVVWSNTGSPDIGAAYQQQGLVETWLQEGLRRPPR